MVDAPGSPDTVGAMNSIDVYFPDLVHESRRQFEERHRLVNSAACDHVAEIAVWLDETVSDVEARVVSCAEAQMAPLLRLCADSFECEEAQDLTVLAVLLRLGVVDLNLGWDPEVDNTGHCLLLAALHLLELVQHHELDDLAAVRDPLVAVLRWSAAEIDAARLRDLAVHSGVTGPVVVDRPGVGPVPLLIDAL